MSATATRTCATCGTDLLNDLGPGQHRYCGPLCRDAGTAKWRAAENDRRREAYVPKDRTCAHCGQTFEVDPDSRQRHRRRYCPPPPTGQSCSEKAHKKRQRAKMGTYECAGCGIAFERLRYYAEPRIKRGEPLYCTRDCWRLVATPPLNRGKRGPRRRVDENGYVFIAGFGAEHRHVMEHIGRRLRVGEFVHHRNGDRADNRIANLELWVRPHPSGQRREDLIDAGRELEREAITAVLANIGVSLTMTDDGVYAVCTGG